MTDPTPETAPRMHAAANESIEAMFKQGCAMEVELAEARKERDAYKHRLRRSAVEHANELLQHVKTKQERDALLAAANRILPFLPDMEPVGAAKYAESNLAAWEFRQLLKTFVR